MKKYVLFMLNSIWFKIYKYGRKRILKYFPIFKYKFLGKGIKAKVKGVSWKDEGLYSIDDLVYINVTYWGFDSKPHIGELVMHNKVANDIIDIFKILYRNKYPVEKMRLIDEYKASDIDSMKDNNTSALCVRKITGKKNEYSKHSYGIAIDINPKQNPYVKDDIILPYNSRDYLNREYIRKGMIIKGDICYKAFVNRGWYWGGDWTRLKDYHHFEKNIEIENLIKTCESNNIDCR